MSDQLPLWGAIGETTVESQFADFHRTRLTCAPGARTAARDILAAHQAWAAVAGAGSIGFRELRRLMIRAGHRQLYSNGSRYADVAILSDGDAIVMDAARHRADRLAKAAVLDRIDRTMTELAELRRLFVEASS